MLLFEYRDQPSTVVWVKVVSEWTVKAMDSAVPEVYMPRPTIQYIHIQN